MRLVIVVVVAVAVAVAIVLCRLLLALNFGTKPLIQGLGWDPRGRCLTVVVVVGFVVVDPPIFFIQLKCNFCFLLKIIMTMVMMMTNEDLSML